MKIKTLSLMVGVFALSLTAIPLAAKADPVVSCYPVTQNRVLEESAATDHAHAYADGFRQGEQSARDRESYKPRTAGGEFARGFEDGYFNRPFTGQENVVPKTIVDRSAQVCNENGYYTAAPPTAYNIYNPPVVYAPPVIYAPPVVYRSPYPIFDFNFGFGRGFYRGRW